MRIINVRLAVPDSVTAEEVCAAAVRDYAIGAVPLIKVASSLGRPVMEPTMTTAQFPDYHDDWGVVREALSTGRAS